MVTIKELKKTWSIDSIAFMSKELGGLQNFVKDTLECPELFNLKRGHEATLNEKRKNEFTIEHSKQGHRADFVIFIKGNTIVIPVEVEKHNNIEKGREQLFQYQKDWDKKYGILTDGNEWRFYKSSLYKSFFINDILRNPSDFVTYWEFYVKPENYYIELFNPSKQPLLFNDKIDLNVPNNRIIFFDEITRLIKNFMVKMNAIGGFDKLPNHKQNEKIAIETTYAYLIQFILYKVLVDNHYRKFNSEYEKILLRIQKAIKDKDFYSIIINEIKNISEYISENIYKPFEAEQKSINRKLIENLKGELNIDTISPWLDIILFINRYNFSGLKNEIFGFIYENYLKDMSKDSNKGQYYTDPAVVNFMLTEIGYNKEALKERANCNKISIIDPSCGAGTFLYSSVDRIIETFDDGTEKQSNHIENLVAKNIFGLDIEEFPLFLAEMNILMRLLPLIVNDNYENPIDCKLKIFKTNDSISEFLDTGINSKLEDNISLFNHLENTALDYPSFMRDEKDLEEMLKTLQENGTKRERFDYVIGNPPYVSYNICSKQKVEFITRMQDKKDNSITMGNVYGMNLNTADGRIKAYSPKPNLYSFFIALGLALLKNDGYLCYVIPQTVLVNADLDVIRHHLASQTTIEKIITFDGKLFIGRGLKQNKPVATSSLIFVVRKKAPNNNHLVKITNYSAYNEDEGNDFEKHISSNDKTEKEILQSELRSNIFNWAFIKNDETYKEILDDFYYKHLSIDFYRRYLKYYDEVILDGSVNLLKKDIVSIDSVKDYTQYYAIPELNKDFLNAGISGYFKKDKKINKAQGSRDFSILVEREYKILWKYINFDGFYYMSGKDVLPMYQQYCIASSDEKEIKFLYGLLNSNLSLFLLEKTFKVGNEDKLTYILGLTFVKEFIHIPSITTQNNAIKEEIIKQTDHLLSQENLKLKDLIEFTTNQQRFSAVEVSSNNIVLFDRDGNETRQRIRLKPELVKSLLEEKYGKECIREKEIPLHDLKYIRAIDHNEQNRIKDYINDLVFALYFNISLNKIGLNEAEHIKELCRANKYYSYIHTVL